VLRKALRGRGIIGVVDGFSPKGIESERDKKDRAELGKDHRDTDLAIIFLRDLVYGSKGYSGSKAF